MNAKVLDNKYNETSRMTRNIIKRLLQLGILIMVQAAILFLSSGRLGWQAAWAYLAVYVGLIIINALVLLSKNPELIAERAQIKADAKRWDKVLSTIIGLFSLALLFIAGLDERFGWSPPPVLMVQLSALLLLGLGFGLFSWAMAANQYFATLVRIQKDRGHAVVTSGPYRIVRHPGYAGMILYLLATPFLLGSCWALIPAAMAAFLLVIRTVLEDRTLQNELDGYTEYARHVRYRLMPGVW